MRILLTQAPAADSSAIEAAAVARGFEVVRCARSGEAPPCLAGADMRRCPLSEHVDVAIDVHGDAPGDQLSTGELGVICAMREGVPVVAVGGNPLGAAATPASPAEALDVAVRLGAHPEGRPPIDAVVRRSRATLARLGVDCDVTWAGYADGAGSFDVVIELSRAVRRSVSTELDASLKPLFWQAVRDRRLRTILYEHRPSKG